MTQKDPFREAREKIRRQQEARKNQESTRQHDAAVKAQKELMDRRLAAARAKAAQRAKEEQIAQEKATLPVEYTVQPGDSLSAIALKFYGNAAYWEVIYQANRKRIGNNPSLIQVGQVLTIPKLD
ncbi:MAG TPA: LysM peptidoglycan-binding domain-containing protein [Anaerolineae bacterium]|nr:LysM peptidoglycan-binding domain-containing protein [Anaerolineae bacterium]HID85610.1 LysM peptidoglycan-binding domain-containing protein [Anaerolineales bacterium]HIQ08611.1 LysM peptidoglycan-binding domain-containing protein [Anaerolineaceae bacterium]